MYDWDATIQDNKMRLRRMENELDSLNKELDNLEVYRKRLIYHIEHMEDAIEFESARPYHWVIIADGGIADRFQTQEEADLSVATGGYGRDAYVEYDPEERG